MAKDPAFLFYPNDYIGGTMGMTFEEKGAYMELLMMQFNRGHMTEQMIGQTIGQLWDIIKDKFNVDPEGLYYNERLEEEQNKRKAFTASRRNNKSGKNQHPKKDGHMTSHMEDENEDINTIVNTNTKSINIEFDIFWNEYDKKVSRPDCEKKWAKLKDEERTSIMDHIPRYKLAQPDKKYRKDPKTFLNQQSWNDELIGANGPLPTISAKPKVDDGKQRYRVRYVGDAQPLIHTEEEISAYLITWQTTIRAKEEV